MIRQNDSEPVGSAESHAIKLEHLVSVSMRAPSAFVLYVPQVVNAGLYRAGGTAQQSIRLISPQRWIPRKIVICYVAGIIA